MRLIALSLLFAATTASAQQPPVATPEEAFAQLDRRLASIAATDSFSGVVAVARDGKILYSRATGIADERTKAPITLDTRFTLASLGKMFTAVAIGQLLDRGKLALTDTVAKFLPDFPNRDARRVTIEQLLAHTSGLGSYWNERYETQREGLYTLADYVPLFADEPLGFTPGARFGYSNAGYIVLGRIVETVSGMSFEDYLKRNVFEKAGMPNTGYYDRLGQTPNGAIGYSRGEKGELRDNLGTRELRGSSAGGGYSTAGDLAAFLHALLENRLLSQRTRELFTSAHSDGPFGPKSYGYGFMRRIRRDTLTAIGHTGGAPGMTAQAFYNDRGYALVVLLNRSGPAVGPVMSESAKVHELLRTK